MKMIPKVLFRKEILIDYVLTLAQFLSSTYKQLYTKLNGNILGCQPSFTFFEIKQLK